MGVKSWLDVITLQIYVASLAVAAPHKIANAFTNSLYCLQPTRLTYSPHAVSYNVSWIRALSAVACALAALSGLLSGANWQEALLYVLLTLAASSLPAMNGRGHDR